MRKLRERLALSIAPWLQRPAPTPTRTPTLVFDYVNGTAYSWPVAGTAFPQSIYVNGIRHPVKATYR